MSEKLNDPICHSPREIPKLFNAEMVRALLERRKTETRRTVKGVPTEAQRFWKEGDAEGYWWCHDDQGVIHPRHFGIRTIPGDTIWVKEAHFAYGWWETTDQLTKNGRPKRTFKRDLGMGPAFFEPLDELKPQTLEKSFGIYKRPSLFMLKADSRLSLQVTDFNIQRLHEIDEAGAIAEGIEPLKSGRGFYDPTKDKGVVRLGQYFTKATDAYAALWDHINGPGAWDANPWVEVTKFTPKRCNIEHMRKGEAA